MLRTRLFTTATSLDLSGIITDETGTGALVFNTNPTLVSPTVNTSLTSNGFVQITDATAATSTTTGALRVAGGISTQDGLYTGSDAFINGARVGVSAGGNTNAVFGVNAGLLLNSAATNSIAIGNGALDAVAASRENVAIGTNALGALTAGAASITNTTPGTGGLSGGSGSVALVTLERDSGTGDMTVYPTVTLTIVSGAVTGVGITTPGTGATVQSGLVFKATAAGIALGAPADWRGTLASVTGQCTAVGVSALQSNTTGNLNSAVGVFALQSNTTGNFNSALGWQALLGNTTGRENSALGVQALQNNTTGSQNSALGLAALLSNTTGIQNSAVGEYALFSNTTGNFNSAVGLNALYSNTTGSNNSAVGVSAGQYRGSGTDTLTSAASSVFIGFQSRANGNSQTNQVVIAGTDGLGDGSNTTVIGNTSTTSTRIPAGNLTLSNGNLILGTAGNGISFAATSDPSIPAVAATGAIRGTATNVANNDTVTIDTTVYTFKTTLTPADYEVLIGGNAADSLTNLRHAILGTGGTPGTDYQVPAAHPTVTAGTIAGSTIPLTAITAGTAGNDIALAETSAQLSVSAATLLGGAAAAGMSGELLNDYETGTWSPRLESTGGTLVGVNQVSNANYTKIGQLVTVQAFVFFTYADTSLASGSLRIAGLPYSVSGHAGAGLYSAQWTVNPAYVQATSGTTLSLFKRSTTSAQSGVVASVPADLDTSTTASRNQMVITFTYRTA